MPFKSIDVFANEKNYKSELKKELRKLDATLSDFFYFEGVEISGAPGTILVLGEASPAVLKTLKSKAKQRVTGKCFVENDTLKMTPAKGKLQDKLLKALLKGTQFDHAIVQGAPDDGGAATADERFLGRLQAAESRFDRIKGQITDEERKELRVFLGRIEETKDSAPEQAARALAALDARMQELIDQLRGGPEPARDEVNARKRLQDTTARFDKVKGKLMDEERKALRAHFGAVAEHMEKAEWKAAYRRLETLDEEMIGYVRAALGSDTKDAGKRSEDFAASEKGKAAKMLALRIKGKQAELEKLERAVGHEAEVLKGLQADLPKLRSKSDIADKKKKIENSAARLEEARRKLEAEKVDLLEQVRTMQAEKLEKEKVFVTAFSTIKSRIADLTAMLDDVPVDQARRQIADVIKKQAEAQKWQEERLKAEASGEGHGTGRHGAQTGMERQAMRASSQQGVTPDQAGNTAGTAQVTEKWNKVRITYTEEDGKRVVANRAEVEKEIAASFAGTQYSGGNASMWATPVLEKEAVDRAMQIAAKFKDFTHYATGKVTQADQVADEFTSLTLKLGPPASAPGWGYAVKRDGAAVPLDDIRTAVSEFEQGKTTLDDMFKKLNVKLVEKAGDGGVKMVPHCLVVLTRAAGGGDWKLKTHFPDDRLGSGDVGWETERNQARGDVTLKSGGTLTVWKNTAFP